jgi:hypothetical protein
MSRERLLTRKQSSEGVCAAQTRTCCQEILNLLFTAVPVSHQSSGEPPYLTLPYTPSFLLPFFLLSPSLLNDRSSTGQSTTQLPENQLEVRLWWLLKGQRPGLVSPHLPPRRRRTPILRWSFPFFFRRQPSLLHIGLPTTTQCP